MKYLLGILVLDRPRAFEQCITHLLQMDRRNDVTMILVDNGSNDETKEMIERYEKEFDLIIHHEWNTGWCFGANSWMSLRDAGQTAIQVDQDMIMHSTDWLPLFERVMADEDIGALAARRPSAWIDRPDKQAGYKELAFEQRHGLWLEMSPHNFLNAPILMYKGELLDHIGFENEATGYGDMDTPYRVSAFGYKSAYIPDVFLYQLQNDWEGREHPQKGAHKALLQKNIALHRRYVTDYMQGKKLYCGTRFLPLTMLDKEYEQQSNETWEFHKNWRPYGI